MLIGLIGFGIAWRLRKRLERRPLALMWLVIALFAVGRFFEFFVRSDSADLALVEIAQWTSQLLLAVAAAGGWLTLRRPRVRRVHPRPPAGVPR